MARPSPRRRGYDTRWDRARAGFLASHPHCRTCLAEGKRTPAVHVHHSTLHRGNMAIFWDRSRWVPLCEEHHNRDAQQVETRGYANRVGRDGVPSDPNHPFNRAEGGGCKSPRSQGVGPAGSSSAELVSEMGASMRGRRRLQEPQAAIEAPLRNRAIAASPSPLWPSGRG